MNLGLIISFYDEHNIVLESLKNIKKICENVTFIAVHTNDNVDSEALREIKQQSNFYFSLDDLSKIYDRNSYQARTISRNFSYGFSKIYQLVDNVDIICACTGDTLIYDANFIKKTYFEFLNKNKKAAIAQAIGQNFHAASDNLIDKKESRYQDINTTDMMPQLFLLDGKFAFNTKCFSNIEVTNVWTSEQCLGDELKSQFENNTDKSFHDNIIRLNEEELFNAYSFKDGVVYHAKNNGIPGR
jgi:hypothetical protein